MKLRKTNCPNCGGILDLHVNENCERVFCPYCGQQYQVEKRRREIVVQKDIHITNHKIDEADIIRAKAESYKAKSRWKVFALILALPVIAFCAFFVYDVFEIDEYIEKYVAEKQGKVHAGWYWDYTGMQYQAVEQYFYEMGFENISLIDMDDANGKERKDGIVDTISINGDSNFGEEDYFSLSDKVIIMYH